MSSDASALSPFSVNSALSLDAPDQKTVRDLDDVLVLILSGDDLGADTLDHGPREKFDIVLLEDVVGVFDQGLRVNGN